MNSLMSNGYVRYKLLTLSRKCLLECPRPRFSCVNKMCTPHMSAIYYSLWIKICAFYLLIHQRYVQFEFHLVQFFFMGTSSDIIILIWDRVYNKSLKSFWYLILIRRAKAPVRFHLYLWWFIHLEGFLLFFSSMRSNFIIFTGIFFPSKYNIRNHLFHFVPDIQKCFVVCFFNIIQTMVTNSNIFRETQMASASS